MNPSDLVWLLTLLLVILLNASLTFWLVKTRFEQDRQGRSLKNLWDSHVKAMKVTYAFMEECEKCPPVATENLDTSQPIAPLAATASQTSTPQEAEVSSTNSSPGTTAAGTPIS